eukprot:CAMPEP_0195298424 /NCGR_PEP_ID=MMETSP0707-20130614/23433_1 /TAXON_ID=33640 /ORGANISM="Asterionellopsis glacialis, Strain CCMP134" /LENGTH=89 /DNA_ID=CAMNT_0040360527 /DNA_START=23 /DNA_END=292 /DNA_ORIENTATION=+
MENIQISPLAYGAATPLISVLGQSVLPIRSDLKTKRAISPLNPQKKHKNLASILEKAMNIIDDNDNVELSNADLKRLNPHTISHTLLKR